MTIEENSLNKKPKLLQEALSDPNRKKNGLCVIFSTEKKYPEIKEWEKYAKENQTDEEIQELYEMRGSKNLSYSYITGIGGLIDIDFDWPMAFHAALRKFGRRMDTLTLETPNGGYRCLFRVDDPYSMLEFKSKPPHVEIHGNKGKHHVIVYGKALNERGELKDYKMVNDAEILHDNEIIKDITEFLREINSNCQFMEYRCIASQLNGRKVHLTHEQRTNIAAFSAASEVDIELAVDFFRVCTDFDEEITRDHLSRIYEKDFKHPKCETLRENFNWDEKHCKGCIRHEKINKRVNQYIEPKESEIEISIATVIANKIIDTCELFTDERDIAYAKYPVASHMEIWPIHSKRFKRYLYKLGRTLGKNHNIPSKEAVNSACSYIEAIAFENPKLKLSNRVAEHEDAIWYDMSNNEWEAVKITPEGWEVIPDPPTILRREIHQKPQVYPLKNGDPWKFFDFVNVPDDKKLLIMVHMISCLIPTIPHPVLITYGSPGAGKSVFTEFSRLIIDPSQVPKLTVPKSDRDLVQNFDHHYAAFFDNLDAIPAWLSDQICRAVTGESSEHRALYTNDEPILRSYRRCVGINGINIAATRTDLLDRSILLKLKRISNETRREENTLREEFHNTMPKIIGGILDVLVRAMAIYPEVKLEYLPRMADFARWGYAIAESLGGYGETFIKLYAADEEERMIESAENNPLSTVVIKLLEEEGKWYGNPANLLEELEIKAEDMKINIESKLWPKNAVWLTRRLNAIEPILASQRILYSNEKSGRERIIDLSYINREGSDSDPSQSAKNTDYTDVLTRNEFKDESHDKSGLKVSDYETVNSTVSDSKHDSISVIDVSENEKDSKAVESVKWSEIIDATGLILERENELIYPVQFQDKLGSILNVDDDDVLLDWEAKLIREGWITQDLRSRRLKATFKLLKRNGNLNCNIGIEFVLGSVGNVTENNRYENHMKTVLENLNGNINVKGA